MCWVDNSTVPVAAEFDVFDHFSIMKKSLNNRLHAEIPLGNMPSQPLTSICTKRHYLRQALYMLLIGNYNSSVSYRTIQVLLQSAVVLLNGIMGGGRGGSNSFALQVTNCLEIMSNIFLILTGILTFPSLMLLSGLRPLTPQGQVTR